MGTFKLKGAVSAVTVVGMTAVVSVVISAHADAASARATIPEFEFDVWGRPPSRQVYELAGQRLTQQILYTINERAHTVAEIAEALGEREPAVAERLEQLKQFDLVKQEGRRWVSNVPMHVEADIREAEKIGTPYAREEAAILRRAIPGLKKLYARTTLSRNFAWDDVSLIIVGALLSDFCVVDRVAFRPENFTEELQPWLDAGGGRKWAYEGYEKLPKRYPSRKWKFYHNQFKKYSGGMARFGYYGSPGEERKDPVVSPGRWMLGTEGKILFALADKPLTVEGLVSATGLQRDRLEKTLQAMAGYEPPAVVADGDWYRTNVPILTESDLDLLLPECDKVAQQIFTGVVLPHLEARKSWARELGRRRPLAGGTHVRDRALQTLVQEGLLSGVPSAPVDWNFGVWGWKGFLAMHDEVAENVQPDPFLRTAVTEEERRRIGQFDAAREAILQGDRFTDASTPMKALLTRISAYVHSDVEALKAVRIFSGPVDESFFAEPGNKNWGQYMRIIRIRRLPPVPGDSQEGDVSPIFTVEPQGYEEAHVYWYHEGSWRVLLNTSRDGFWRRSAERVVRDRLRSVENR